MVILDACFASKSYLKFFLKPSSHTLFHFYMNSNIHSYLNYSFQITINKRENTIYHQIFTHLFVVLLIQGVSLHICGLGRGFFVALLAFILSLSNNILWTWSGFSWDANSSERAYFYTAVLCVTNSPTTGVLIVLLFCRMQYWGGEGSVSLASQLLPLYSFFSYSVFNSWRTDIIIEAPFRTPGRFVSIFLVAPHYSQGFYCRGIWQPENKESFIISSH